MFRDNVFRDAFFTIFLFTIALERCVNRGSTRDRARPRTRGARDARCRVQLPSLANPRSVSLLVTARQRERTTSESNLVAGQTARSVANRPAKLLSAR